jgi:hypothetical protein
MKPRTLGQAGLSAAVVVGLGAWRFGGGPRGGQDTAGFAPLRQKVIRPE